MIINGDGGYGLLAAYTGGPAAPAEWLAPKAGGHLAPFLYSSREPSELSQWLCHEDSTINIVVVIIIIIKCQGHWHLQASHCTQKKHFIHKITQCNGLGICLPVCL